MAQFDYASRYFGVKSQWTSDSSELGDFKFRWGFEVIADTWLRKISPTVLDYLKKTAPVGKHFDIGGVAHPTYSFRGSLYPITFHEPGRTRLQIMSRAKHAKFLMQGTRAHEINAKPGGVLAFWWDRMSVPMRTMHVNHPGTKPTRFHITARRDLEGYIGTVLANELKKHYGK